MGKAIIFALLYAAALSGVTADCDARVIEGNPQTYRALLGQLRPGDVLQLVPGEYDGLPIRNLHGSADRPITVAGHPDKTVIVGNPVRNTVSITNASHVVIRDLRLDVRSAATDGVVCEHGSVSAHHITIENLTMVNFAADRFTVGIATRCPAWEWIIRANRIIKPGTGMYLGGSDGSAPFFAATIEDNEIQNPIGYGMQIKHQIARPQIEGMPSTTSMTVIRRNRIVKSEGASTGPDARPSLLVGHFPLTGAGSTDLYLIHSNVLYDNPTEALFQGEGNVALYNNVLVNPHGSAVNIRPHNDRPRTVHVFHNTIIAAGTGISIEGADIAFDQYVGGNAVFASRPLEGARADRNFVASQERARAYFVNPDGPLADLDLNPRDDALSAEQDVPAAMRQFPGASTDLLGSSRKDTPMFGACLKRMDGAHSRPPCR